MRTPIGRISRLALFVIAVLVAAVVAGLIVPGHTGKWIEIGAWLAICSLVVGSWLRTTPSYGKRPEEGSGYGPFWRR
jgi:hypothetical protein